MGGEEAHFTTVLMALFAIMNPIANAPIFVGLTEGMDAEARRGTALRGVLLAFAIVAAFALLGRAIFDMFGITLPAFRIAGGILVGLVGYHLLQGQESRVHHPTAADTEASRDAAPDVAITPLAIPILAGPGTIATAMSYAADGGMAAVLRVLAAMAIVCVLTWLSFLGSDSLTKVLGQNAIKVVSRLMGLILAVIGTQMVIAGVRGAIAASS